MKLSKGVQTTHTHGRGFCRVRVMGGELFVQRFPEHIDAWEAWRFERALTLLRFTFDNVAALHDAGWHDVRSSDFEFVLSMSDHLSASEIVKQSKEPRECRRLLRDKSNNAYADARWSDRRGES